MYREMTPRTRVLYAFGESPAKDLDLINRAVNKRPAPLTATNGAGGFQVRTYRTNPSLGDIIYIILVLRPLGGQPKKAASMQTRSVRFKSPQISLFCAMPAFSV
jgi:hypothetical protein